MKKHEILSPQSRAVLFDPPIDPAAIVRHYTFSPEDLALIRQRRRDANRLGFAVHLAYLRFPGRVLGIEEIPPADILSFIADQLSIKPESLNTYARREETLQRAVTRVKSEQASKVSMRMPTLRSLRGRQHGMGKQSVQAPARSAGVVGAARWKGGSWLQGETRRGEGSGLTALSGGDHGGSRTG